MRVTSVWHMFPGTTVFEASNGSVSTIKVLGWPETEPLFSGVWITWFDCICNYGKRISFGDSGIPKSTYNNHATFTTQKEAENYLARFINY